MEDGIDPILHRSVFDLELTNELVRLVWNAGFERIGQLVFMRSSDLYTLFSQAERDQLNDVLVMRGIVPPWQA